MVEYLTLNILFLSLVFLIVIGFSDRPIFTKSRVAALGILLLMTAVFDNLIIMAGIVDYDPALITGLRVGEAPIEDFAYSVAAILLVPFIFEKVRRHP